MKRRSPKLVPLRDARKALAHWAKRPLPGPTSPLAISLARGAYDVIGAVMSDGTVWWESTSTTDPRILGRVLDRLISRAGPDAPLVLPNYAISREILGGEDDIILTDAPPSEDEPDEQAPASQPDDGDGEGGGGGLGEGDGDGADPNDGAQSEASGHKKSAGDEAEGSCGSGQPDGSEQSETGRNSPCKRDAPAQPGRQAGPEPDSGPSHEATGPNGDGKLSGPEGGHEPKPEMGSGDGDSGHGADCRIGGARSEKPADRPAQGADGDSAPSAKASDQGEPPGEEAGSLPGGEFNDNPGAGCPAPEAPSISATIDSDWAEIQEVELFAGGSDAPSIKIPAIEQAELYLLRRESAIKRAQRAIERMLRDIIAPRGRRVPIIDERKLVNEIITMRYALSRARKELGQPRRIIISPDGSGSCGELIELTMPIARALQQELPGTIVIVPNANGCPYAHHPDWHSWPEALRQIGRDKGVMPGSSPYDDSAPVGFWGRVLRDRFAEAILYLGDSDADNVWWQLDNRRVIAVRANGGYEAGENTTTIDFDFDNAGSATSMEQYANSLARALETARIKF